MNAQRAIRDYKARHDLTYRELAERLGIGESLARKLGCGLRKRTRATTARRIEQRTRGAIRAVDLVL